MASEHENLSRPMVPLTSRAKRWHNRIWPPRSNWIAEQGSKAFYGEIAQKLVADMTAHQGLITLTTSKLSALVRAPVRGTIAVTRSFPCHHPVPAARISSRSSTS